MGEFLPCLFLSPFRTVPGSHRFSGPSTTLLTEPYVSYNLKDYLMTANLFHHL